MVYLDSSALVKRYVSEKGSSEIEGICAGDEPVYTSSLSYAEVIAAFARKTRERLLTPATFDTILNRFLADWTIGLNEIPIDRGILASLAPLFRVHPLRGSDGVHLASALWLLGKAQSLRQRCLFCAADEKLVNAATSCALSVFNPETV